MIIGLLKGVVVGKYNAVEDLPARVKGITGPDDLKKKSIKELTILFNSLVPEDQHVAKFPSVTDGANKCFAAMEAFEVAEPMVKEVKATRAPKEPKEPRATKTDAIRAYIEGKDEFTVEEIMQLVADDRRGNVTTTLTILCNPVRTKKNPIPYKYDKTIKKFVKVVPVVATDPASAPAPAPDAPTA